MKSTEKFVLIIFDISDNKRRRKIVKLLKSHGTRVQKSAFECIVTPAKIDSIIQISEKILNFDEDNFRIYTLNSYNTIYSFGSDAVFINDLFGFV